MGTFGSSEPLGHNDIRRRTNESRGGRPWREPERNYVVKPGLRIGTSWSDRDLKAIGVGRLHL